MIRYCNSYKLGEQKNVSIQNTFVITLTKTNMIADFYNVFNSHAACGDAGYSVLEWATGA